MKQDFALLYSQLRLRPDCTFEEFRRAYRRRIAALHPDKAHAADTRENLELLPDLIRLYATATRFYRRHGRLPGARPSGGPSGRAAGPAAPVESPASANDARAGAVFPAPDEPMAELRTNRGPPLGLSLTVIALAVVLAWNLPLPSADLDTVDQPTRDPPELVIPPGADFLQLGMDTATVLAIQGEPIRIEGDEWDYRTSWLRFERGRLIDWHSSPLHPLKTQWPEPQPTSATGPDSHHQD